MRHLSRVSKDPYGIVHDKVEDTRIPICFFHVSEVRVLEQPTKIILKVFEGNRSGRITITIMKVTSNPLGDITPPVR